MPSECVFTLNGNEDEVYHSGKDVVDGVITLRTVNKKNIKGISVGFVGRIICAFDHNFYTGPGQTGTLIHSINYTGKEIIINHKEVVRGPGLLAAGVYTFPFRYVVGEDCPTSVEGTDGHIRYQIYLKIYNESKYNNIFIKPITIVKTDDLNLRDECILPVEIYDHSTRCCGLFNSRGKLNFSTNFGGYSPGLYLRYDLELFEKSVKNVTNYEIQFIREIIYLATYPSKTKSTEETILYSEVTPDNNLPYQLLVWAFEVPSTPPTLKTNLISIRYFLRATLRVRCCDPNRKPQLVSKLFVPIGTIPPKESLILPLQRRLVSGPCHRWIIRPSCYMRADPLDKTFIDTTTPEINRNDTFMPAYPSYIKVYSDW